MEQLFHSSQTTQANHQKNAILLKRIFEKEDFDVTIKKLINIISRFFQIDYKDERKLYVERIINFLITFCTNIKNCEDIEKDPIINAIFQFLLEAYNTIYPSYRYWSCRFLYEITENFPELNEDISGKFIEAMLERMLDDKVDIRLQAIKFLYRYQDPHATDDAIIEELSNAILDANSKIRKLVVEKIAINKTTLTAILDRCRDVEINVRLAAFARISKLMRNIKIIQRRTILYCGFSDESDKVRNFLHTTFLKTWLDTYDNNYIELLKSIRLDSDEDDIQMTCQLYENIWKALFVNNNIGELIKILPITSNRQIDFDQLSFESVLCWRILVKHLRTSDRFEDYLDLILPECVHFCKYIKNFCDYICKNNLANNQIRQFILKQFFLITKDYDYTDNKSRQCLNLLIRFVLENVQLDLDVVQVLIENLENTILDTNQRINFLIEIILNIKYPVDVEKSKLTETENAQKRDKIRLLEQQKQQLIDDKDFFKAEQIKNEIIENEQQLKQLSNDDDNNKTENVDMILRYLTIAEALLKSTKLTKFTSELKSLHENTILDVLLHENDKIKVKALHCCALVSLLDYKTAQYTIHILSSPIFAYQRGEDCLTEILQICMKAVFDLIFFYGSRLIAEPNEDNLNDSQKEEHLTIFIGGTGLTELLQGIVDLMDDEQIELQETSVQVLCKLLLNNCIQSTAIIARLILKWIHPDDDIQSIKQYIGKTLNAFPSKPYCFNNFEDAILIVVETIVKAPKTSPLYRINLEKTAKFMLSLCQASEQGFNVQRNLIYKLLNNLSDQTDKILINVLAKMLLWLDVPNDEQTVEELLEICEDIDNDNMSRQARHNLIKFIDSLKSKTISEIIQE